MPRPAYVVEAHSLVRLTLVRLLEKDGFRVREFSSAKEVTQHLDKGDIEEPVVAFVEAKLSGQDDLDGVGVVASLLERFPHLPVVAVLASPVNADAMRAAGARDYLAKPFTTVQFRVLLASLGISPDPSS